MRQEKLPYAWFYNVRMDNGNYTEHLMRVFDGKIYYVILDGSISYYVGAHDATWHSYTEESFMVNTGSSRLYDYYSETIGGDIKEMTNDAMDDLLKKYGLKDQYDAEKIDAKKSSYAYFGKEKDKRMRYVKLMNEKAK